MTTSADLVPAAVPGVARDSRAPRTADVVRRLRALLVGLVAVAAGLVGIVVVPTTAYAAGETEPVAASFDAQVLAETNAVRKSHGLRPLKAKACTHRFAKSWTRSLAARDTMYHQPLRPIMKRCKLRAAGENLAWRGGSLSAAKVVSMWMASPGHRRNILTARFRTLSVDAFKSTDTGRIYASQVFGG